MSDLEALALRCEQAMGADRELDIAIFKVIGAPVPFQFVNKLIALEYNDQERAYFARVTDDMQVRYCPPAYTASLDAAMTLVPEGWSWTVAVGIAKDGKHSAAGVLPPCSEGPQSRAATPALALTASALRARAQVQS